MSEDLKSLIAQVRDEAEYAGESDPLILRDIVLKLCRAAEPYAAMERLEVWAREDCDWTPAASFEYREGFRDAQRDALGLIRAWTEPAA